MERVEETLKKEGRGNEFLRQVVELILDETGIVGNAESLKEKQKKLLEFMQPKKLENSLDLTIKKEGQSNDALLDFCREIIARSVKTTHPNFYNQLYGGAEGYGIAGSWLTDALNTSMATYETSPLFTLMERSIIQHSGKLIGYPSDTVDGIFCPGGSVGNMYGMILARQRAFPEVKTKGILHINKTLVTFVSEDAHYSFTKGAIWLGQGSASVVKVKSDEKGRMIPCELDKAIQKCLQSTDQTPLLVAATCGTTVLGAFDPLEPISQICQKYNLWLHVDAALGGTVLFSQKHRHLMSGVHHADSVTWNFHKMACVPLQCTMLVTKHIGLLAATNSLKAEYLFQSDKYYDKQYDMGDKSLQCGRKVDSLKCWMLLKAYGDNGMETLVDQVFENAKYLTKALANRPGFQLVLDEFQSNNICFYYTPPLMRNCVPVTKERLNLVAPLIKEKMMTTGSIMIGHQPLSHKGLPNFWRIVLSCFPQRSKADLDYVIEQFEVLGKEIKL